MLRPQRFAERRTGPTKGALRELERCIGIGEAVPPLPLPTRAGAGYCMGAAKVRDAVVMMGVALDPPDEIKTVGFSDGMLVL